MTSEEPLTARVQAEAEHLAETYAGEKREQLPIYGYATTTSVFAAVFGTLLLRAAARGSLPKRIRAADILLLGIATHKLARIVSRDFATIPLRFAFTRYEKNVGAGEVKETARGSGLRRAVGDLLSCQFCTGPWIASTLTALLIARPRVARTVSSVLAMVTVSDFLHHVYAYMKVAPTRASSPA